MSGLVLLGILALLPLVYIYHGLVLLQLWGWFMVPLGLPEIGMAHAIGVSSTIGFITYQTQEKRAGKEYSGQWGMRLSYPIVTLFAGWIIHLFM